MKTHRLIASSFIGSISPKLMPTIGRLGWEECRRNNFTIPELALCCTIRRALNNLFERVALKPPRIA
jgi:hypothetical protein